MSQLLYIPAGVLIVMLPIFLAAELRAGRLAVGGAGLFYISLRTEIKSV